MQILVGEEIRDCKVIFRKRRTLCIQIRPPGEITILSPIGKSDKDIREAVQTKERWINKKLFEMQKMPYLQIEKQYISGETFSYLGQNYTLEIIENPKFKRTQLKIEGNKFFVYTANNNPAGIRLKIESWYRKKALENISERIAYYQGCFQVMPTQVVVKKQKKRWGSCTAKRKLFFNFKCVMLPLWILDYIVVHEMCHMVHLNHSKEFWGLVEQILPDYRERKEWLKHNGGVVI